MDPPATADAASSSPSTSLRKRLSVNTSSSPSSGRERESKARQEMMDRGDAEMGAAEPMSPAGRLFREAHFNCYIVALLGLGAPVDVAAARAGLEATLVRHPRFSSLQVSDDATKNAKPRWVRTTVNLDDHFVFPHLDPAATSADPDRAVEDYVSSLSTMPMDHSRPLWEFHVLDFPTSEAAAAVAIRMHHSLGDGVSLISLLMACTRSAADPTRLPAMPPLPTRTGAIYQRPRPSAGALAYLAWLWSFIVLAWHTAVDVVAFFATILCLKDPHTLFKRVNHAESQRKRIVHRSLSLDDVKFVKNAMKCTVNDVLVGVTYAALSRYYFRKSGDTDKEIRVRSILLVNLRPTTSLHACVNMIESGKGSDVKWGNKLGFIILPFFIGKHSDPLDYVRKAKKVVDRKKSSLEVVFTHLAAEVILKVFGLKAAAAIFHRMISHTTISFSSMTGPVEQVEFCGHPVVFIAPSGYGPPEVSPPNVYDCALESCAQRK